MKKNYIINTIDMHLKQNFWLYIISLLILTTGVVFGIYTVKYMGELDKNNMLKYFECFSFNFKTQEINSYNILNEAIKNNIIFIIIFWVLGLTLVGIPMILFFDFIKGFTLGFSISFIMYGLGFDGIWLSLLGIIPQNVIYIPCIILSSVLSIKFSLEHIRVKINKGFIDNFWNKFYNYSICYIFISIFMFLGFILESYITPYLVKSFIS
ncbi:MAG: stage II sporulation protein M [Clostridiaceae bacterium]